MKWIRQNIKTKIFYLFILFFWLIALSPKAFAASKNYHDQSNAQSNNDSEVVIIGLPKEKEQKLLNGMQQSKMKHKLIRQAKEHIDHQEYHQALDVLNTALKYSNQNNASAWNIRWYRTDVYEALGMKNEYITELNWLISQCENEATKQKLISRREG